MLKKIILISFLIFSFFLVISNVAAANYYVDTNIKHSDIASWMKNDAKKGDNLIFTESKYDLTNTIVISKSINIKSENKTQINFKKIGKNMFNVTVSGVNFDRLSLNHWGELHDATISASGSFKKINIKNTDITVKKGNVSPIQIENWQGNVTNCKIDAKIDGFGLWSNNWVCTLVNSKIITGYGINIDITEKWKGNMINSELSSPLLYSISANYWSGKITGSKISCYGHDGDESNYNGVSLYNSKGTITNSTIKVKQGIALGVSDEVKVSKCSISSEKNHPKIYRYHPDLKINSVKKSGQLYKISFSNLGYIDSKPCTLVIKYRNKILKKVSVKSLKRFLEKKTVKVAIPTKYANIKYTKTAIIDYNKKNKEYNEKNNQCNFKF